MAVPVSVATLPIGSSAGADMGELAAGEGAAGPAGAGDGDAAGRAGAGVGRGVGKGAGWVWASLVGAEIASAAEEASGTGDGTA